MRESSCDDIIGRILAWRIIKEAVISAADRIKRIYASEHAEIAVICLAFPYECESDGAIGIGCFFLFEEDFAYASASVDGVFRISYESYDVDDIILHLRRKEIREQSAFLVRHEIEVFER